MMTARVSSVQDGYSLMEAMVALFILAIATVGLTRATQAHIDSVRGLEMRAVAQWVAENRLVEMSLASEAGQPATVPMMGRDWRVDTETRPTSDPDLIAVDVRVGVARDGADENDAVVSLSGFADRLAGGV